MVCFTWIVLIIGFVFVMITLLRWFEQVTEAVELGLWNKVVTLIAVPFLVWFYPGRVSAGRPTPFPLHEPVRGFGTLPRAKADRTSETRDARDAPFAAVTSIPPTAPAGADAAGADAAPPGTPAEFLGLPKVPPPKPKGAKPAIDAEKIAKLRQKMREQGMLGPEE